jgi:archaellum biogenesis ATPase FlaH
MKKQLIMVPFQQYNNVVMDVTKEVAGDHDRICYVTLNKTYRAMLARFDKYHIKPEKFHFLDLITPKVLEFDPTERCTFLESTTKLDSFAEKLITIVKQQGSKCLIFDSLSSFLVYKTDEEVLELFNYINAFLEDMNVNMVIFVLQEDSKRPAVKQMEMTVDKVKKW